MYIKRNVIIFVRNKFVLLVLKFNSNGLRKQLILLWTFGSLDLWRFGDLDIWRGV